MTMNKEKIEKEKTKEVILNALLEASKNLLNKIENNIEKINGLDQKIKKNGGINIEKRGEI